MGSLTIPAKMTGTRYLERVLDQLYDPYEIAIVTYALTIVNSPSKDAAFEKLDGLKNTLGNFLQNVFRWRGDRLCGSCCCM